MAFVRDNLVTANITNRYKFADFTGTGNTNNSLTDTGSWLVHVDGTDSLSVWFYSQKGHEAFVNDAECIFQGRFICDD